MKVFCDVKVAVRVRKNAFFANLLSPFALSPPLYHIGFDPYASSPMLYGMSAITSCAFDGIPYRL